MSHTHQNGMSHDHAFTTDTHDHAGDPSGPWGHVTNGGPHDDAVRELQRLHKQDVIDDLQVRFPNVALATIEILFGMLWNELSRIDSRNERTGMVARRAAQR